MLSRTATLVAGVVALVATALAIWWHLASSQKSTDEDLGEYTARRPEPAVEKPEPPVGPPDSKLNPAAPDAERRERIGALLRDLSGSDFDKALAAADALWEIRARHPEILAALESLYGRLLKSDDSTFEAMSLIRLASLQSDTQASVFVAKVVDDARKGKLSGHCDLFPFHELADLYHDLSPDHPVQRALEQAFEKRLRDPSPTLQALVGAAICRCGNEEARRRFRETVLQSADASTDWWAVGLLASDPSLLASLDQLSPFERKKVVEYLWLPAWTLDEDIEKMVKQNFAAVSGLLRESLTSTDPEVRKKAFDICRKRMIQANLSTGDDLSRAIDAARSEFEVKSEK